MDSFHDRPRTSRRKILYLINEDVYFWTHRLPLARAARDAGLDVVVVTRVESHGDRIRQEGFRLIPIEWRRGSLNPWREAAALATILNLYRRERPDIVHHVALKQSLYGTLAARLTRIPAVVNAVTGLGYVFTSRQPRARMLAPALKFSIRWLFNHPSCWLIVQNPDDQRSLSEHCAIPIEKTVLIRGSGVDLDQFAPVPEPDGTPNVTMVSRMIWDKGVGELVEAARYLRRAGEEVDVTLVGLPDPENPTSVPESRLRSWQDEGIVRWWGYRDNIADVWARSTIAVLPSYREGAPKALIEAAACGRPIITTDVPGCREIVRHGENGLLVPPKDVTALAEAIRRLIHDADLRHRMGKSGRDYVASGFSQEIVVGKTMGVYESLIGGREKT